MKKIELHVHLEGTITPSLAKTLAQRNGLCLDTKLFDDERFVWRDFLDFLRVYDAVADVIKHPLDYYDITYDYLKRAALEGACYVEMMYSPEHAERTTGIPSTEHLSAIGQAIDDARSTFDVIGRIIITAVRHYGVESAEHVARRAIKEQAPCIAGFGLGGDELNYPPDLFIKAYDIAHGGGLPCTIHAGEFGPPETIEHAINKLPIQRLGHGVRAIESAHTLELIKERNIHLEVCPSSNVATGVFQSLESHPIKRLFDAGVSLSINSDDPPYFETSLGLEYQRTISHCGLSHEMLDKINLMAIEASFSDAQTKKELKEKVV